MKIKMICKKCGKEPKKNEEKSTKDFEVYDNKPCEYCGGELTFDFEE